jgi:hypothetical protein
MSGWHVFAVESLHDLENAFSLVGTCASSPKRSWRGQRCMMKEGWTSGVDGCMISGSGRSHVPSSVLKRIFY